mmetsp:Transcript_63578/g.113142  ORF Transcript_63578/g.113142 Transcript_63578/m.113142 type:complete len:425 (+) Transcript_63578:83-1357(+)
MRERSSSKTSVSSKTSTSAYKVLGVAETADLDDIKRAYKRLALKFHPDKAPSKERNRNENLFKDLAGAYDKIRDPKRRDEYDERRSKSVPVVPKRTAEAEDLPATRPATPAEMQRRLFRQQSAARSASLASNGGVAPASELLRNLGMDAPRKDAQMASVNATVPSMGKDGSRQDSRPRPGAARPGARHGGRRPATAPEEFGTRRAAAQLQRTPSGRAVFTHGSSLVSQLSKGGQQAEEGETLGFLRTMADWVLFSCASRGLLEVRGCVQRGEVPAGREEALSNARIHSTLDYLTATCLVPAERCRVSNLRGEESRGVEIRAMAPVCLDCSFKAESTDLEDVGTLDAAIDALAGASCRRLYVEVRFSTSQRTAQRRMAALMGCLISRGLSRKRFRGQVRAGLTDEAAFYAYDEFASDVRSASRQG